MVMAAQSAIICQRGSMRLRLQPFALLALLAWMLACADRRESLTREQLTKQVMSESNGALVLASMTTTNGFAHQREGMKLHTIEWEATLRVHASGWKVGWRDYRVLASETNALAAAVDGLPIGRVVKDGTVALQGKSELQKADRGWRVLHSEVTAVNVSRPPEAAAEGRSTNLDAFFTAFKAAVAARNNQALAKFIHFPYSCADQFTMTEGEFMSHPFPFSNEQSEALAKIVAPIKIDDAGRHYLVDALVLGGTEAFSLDVTQDADDYWKVVKFDGPICWFGQQQQ